MRLQQHSHLLRGMLLLSCRLLFLSCFTKLLCSAITITYLLISASVCRFFKSLSKLGLKFRFNRIFDVPFKHTFHYFSCTLVTFCSDVTFDLYCKVSWAGGSCNEKSRLSGGNGHKGGKYVRGKANNARAQQLRFFKLVWLSKDSPYAIVKNVIAQDLDKKDAPMKVHSEIVKTGLTTAADVHKCLKSEEMCT